MASITTHFVSAADFSFGTQLTMLHRQFTTTTINWNYASSEVDVKARNFGTGTSAFIGGHTFTTNWVNGRKVGDANEAEITGSTNPTFAAMANTNTRFYAANPYDPNDLSGGAVWIIIFDLQTGNQVARVVPVYTIDANGVTSGFHGYIITQRNEYIVSGAQYRMQYEHSSLVNTVASVRSGVTVCFLSGTRIAVPLGETTVEQLRVGDTVLTGNGPQAVSWISSSRKNGAETPPVVFTPAAFASGALSMPEGARLPERPLKVSQQHCMVLKDQRARAFLGTDRFLLAAKHLVNGDTIYLDRSAGDLEYFHLMFDQHQIVLAEGAWSESFYPGTEALKALTMTQVRDVYEIAPDLMDDPASGYGPTALPRLTGGEYKRMLMGKGPTPGQRQRRLAADDLRAQRLDVSVAGYGAPFALPVQPSAHKSMAAHSK